MSKLLLLACCALPALPAVARATTAIPESTFLQVTSADIGSYGDPGGVGFNYTQGSYQFALGFQSSLPLNITQLGYYDPSGTPGYDGAAFGSHQVAVYDLTTNTLVQTATVDSSSPRIGVFRYTPVTFTGINPSDVYGVAGISGATQYLVGTKTEIVPVGPHLTLLGGAGSGPTATLSAPTSFGFGGDIFGTTAPSDTLPDLGPNFRYTTAYGGVVVVPETKVAVADGDKTDELDYEVNTPPTPTLTPSGRYHYTYKLTYSGSPTLVLPLHNAGDVTGLSGGTLVAYHSISGDLQTDFGTSYSTAISVALPYSADETTYPISFDSAYAPSEVTIALVGTDGVIRLVDPPIPDSTGGGTPVPEPASGALLAAGLATAALLRRRHAHQRRSTP